MISTNTKKFVNVSDMLQNQNLKPKCEGPGERDQKLDPRPRPQILGKKGLES